MLNLLIEKKKVLRQCGEASTGQIYFQTET